MERFFAEIKNGMAEFDALMSGVDGFARRAAISGEAEFNLRLVVEELATNIIKYAFGGAAGALKLEIIRDGDLVKLTVRDAGRAFNPLDNPPPDLSVPPQERCAGGLGIHLVRSLSARAEYERKDGENVLAVYFDLTKGETK